MVTENKEISPFVQYIVSKYEECGYTPTEGKNDNFIYLRAMKDSTEIIRDMDPQIVKKIVTEFNATGKISKTSLNYIKGSFANEKDYDEWYLKIIPKKLIGFEKTQTEYLYDVERQKAFFGAMLSKAPDNEKDMLKIYTMVKNEALGLGAINEAARQSTHDNKKHSIKKAIETAAKANKEKKSSNSEGPRSF